MKLAHHYRILGLRRSASFSDVKKAYRRLVRQCHPDIHPGQAATDQFIQINAAYTALCEAFQQQESHPQTTDRGPAADSEAASNQPERLNLKELKRTLEKLGLGNFQEAAEHSTSSPSKPKTQTASGTSKTDSTSASRETANAYPESVEPKAVKNTDPATEEDVVLKKEAYGQLRDLLRQQKFPRAIALVEGLAHRLPTDTEINQWQAIVYQRWGRQLISQGQFHKAHLYLKKALQTDPNNPSLGKEVARDLGLLKHIRAAEATLS